MGAAPAMVARVARLLSSLLISSFPTVSMAVPISLNGLPINEHQNITDSFKEAFIDEYIPMDDEKKSSDLIVAELIKKIIRRIIREDSNKKPQVNSHIIRI